MNINEIPVKANTKPVTDTRHQISADEFNVVVEAVKTIGNEVNDLPSVPKMVSELENDRGYQTSDEVLNLIETHSGAGGGGEVDLSGYATTEYVDEKMLHVPTTLGEMTNVESNADDQSSEDVILLKSSNSEKWHVKKDNTMKCSILPSIEAYEALQKVDQQTMYIIVSNSAITNAYIGVYPFSVGGSGVDDILIDYITLSSYNVTLDEDSVKIIATLFPDNATSRSLKWTSSDINVVRAISDGTLAPINNGQAVVSVTAVRGGASADISVEVEISVKSVKIMNTDEHLRDQEPVQISAEVLPAKAKDKTLSYISNNPSIATVSETGLVTHVSDGQVTISVQSKNNITDTITLNAITPVRGIQIINKVPSLDVGEIKRFSHQFSPVSPTNKSVIWSTSDVDVVSIDQQGQAQAVKRGNVLITVTSQDGSFTDENNLRIIVPATSLEITGNNLLVLGYQFVFNYIPTPSDADVDELIWSVSDPTMATITQEGVLTPLTGSGTFLVKVLETKHNIEATYQVMLAELSLRSVTCQEGDVVESIFTNWEIDAIGNATSLTFTEKTPEGSVLQTDTAVIPIAGNKLPIELYAEFGDKNIEFTISNESGLTDKKTKTVKYVEPELIHYDFEVNVQCSQEEAAAMEVVIPEFKYDKKFVYSLRNDDGRPSIWRGFFRYTAGLENLYWMPYSHMQDKEIARFKADPSYNTTYRLSRGPRRLGYTDGCGVLKTFTYDTAGTVIDKNGVKYWENTAYRDFIDEDDTWRMKDFGGHFVLHDIEILESDPVKPKYDMDITYALQRDRQAIYEKFGYTAIHVANPNGTWYHTMPSIKDPKTLCLSGGGNCYGTDPNGVYGKPTHRQTYKSDVDYSKIPLSEIRNCLLTYYLFNSYNMPNNIFVNKYWREGMANWLHKGKYNFHIEISHMIGDDEDKYVWQYNNNKWTMDEMYDVAGAIGNDLLWMASPDEVVEYMYYKRCATVQKEITSSGCKFIVSFDIPDYLSYKTYSLIINGLNPSNSISYRSEIPLTYYNKNMKTGLVNWGYSPDISERAYRYIARYKSVLDNDTLDLAWYFANQMGEIGNELKKQLPEINRLPIISVINIDEEYEVAELTLSIKNSNKEFGEIDYIEISESSDFTISEVHNVPYDGHKVYDIAIDRYDILDFQIKIKSLFGVQQKYYVRAGNFNGKSNIISYTTSIKRIIGKNDPAIKLNYIRAVENDNIKIQLNPMYVSEYRYSLNGVLTEWNNISDEVVVNNLSVGNNTIIFECRNNMNDVITEQASIYYHQANNRILCYELYDTNSTSKAGFDPEAQATRFVTFWVGMRPLGNPVNMYDQNGVVVGRCGPVEYINGRTEYPVTNDLPEIEWSWDGGGLVVDESPILDAIYHGNAIQRMMKTTWRANAVNSRQAMWAEFNEGGKYLVKIFVRHLDYNINANGRFFYRKNVELKINHYYEWSEYVDVNMSEFYNNKEKTINFVVDISSGEKVQFGVDCLWQHLNLDGINHTSGWNCIEFIKLT